MSNPYYPKKQGLYDPAFEHDACGVGFIVHLKGLKSHKIVAEGLKILENLSHRGACGCDPETGDGAGILIQMPDKFLRKESKKISIDLPPFGQYGAGIMFLPTNLDERNQIEKWTEHIIREEGQTFLGWRDVPHHSEAIGKVARSVEPELKMLFVGCGEGIDVKKFDRKLYVIRKRLYNKVFGSRLSQKSYYYTCSLSSKTIVYKGQLMAGQVGSFFDDLRDSDMESAIALTHSRYSTNTFPSWALAHPYRMIAHNGEINTLRGNSNWLYAREVNFISEKFGEDLKKTLPVIVPYGSDSATFDNVFELLVLSGRSLSHTILMMVPEAWSGHESMPSDKRAFYEYHSCLMEPWDGPSAICFTDGECIGAILDRNGLRPSRYWVTSDDICVMGSEAGVLPMDTKKVIKKGRLEPGKIFLIDTVEGRIINDDELKQRYIDRQPYEEWIKTNVVDLRALPEPKKVNGLCKKTLLERQRAFGYTVEDIKVILRPMSMMGIEATGAMGDDTPLAILSQKPKLLYEYFKQLFAQVTNPPVDPIREEIIMAEDVMLGAEGNLLDETLGHCRRLRLKRPILTNKELEKIVAINENNLKSIKLNMLFERSKGGGCLEEGLEKLFKEADQAISDGVSILILTDRGVSKNKVPMPSLLACASLHHHLIRQGTRVRVSIVLETGEAREIHHFATLIGYGANAINPYLTFETIEDEINQGNYYGFKYSQAEHNYIKSTRKGLFKVLSKMGISTIQSYCGAQVFEAIGLGENFIDKYFLGTSSRIGGIGIEQIAEESLWRHSEGYFTENRYDSMLDIGGRYAWRKEGEHHQLNPETIAFLQHACRTNDYECYKKYSKLINTRQTNLANIRGLLKFKKRTPIPIEEVESATEIVKRFATGAMSFGSISKEAHETLAIAMNRLGGFSNTGEGGEKPERFLPLPNGDSRRSRIKQVAQGRFGVTIEYLANADQIQIKMAQGAKPGEGGQLPGHKVSQEIADTRLTTKGVGLISPPPHHDIYSIEDLSQLIHDLKNANPDADVSVKLVSEIGVGTIAAGVSKGKSDHLLISGYEGGTGASPQTSIKNAGLPMELGIAETQQVLVMNDLRGRIRVQTDGQLKTGRDVVIAGMLGADEFGFATTALITMGCVLLRKCHLNTCSVGIATQDKSLRKKFAGKPEYVVNFFMFIAEEIREIMASLGIKEFNDLVGRVEYLETNDLIGHWKARGIDLINILHKVDVPDHVAIRHVGRQNHDLEMALDNTLIEKAKEAIEKQKPVSFKSKIVNVNRTVGTMMSGIVAKRYGLKGLPEDCIKIKFDGSAGQSFGAFLAHGITLELEGDSNDYVGKGLSGGKIIIYPPKNAPAAFIAEDNIIIGNVVLYGGISGEAYFRGIGGERFCVRNSGVHVVIEGIGDHGCEYMTGGRVVVLGRIGRNFAAGMSGGIAYIWDKDGDFERRCNMDLVELFPVDVEEDVCELKTMIEKHFAYTGSTRAKEILDEWTKTIVQFVKVYPTDYRRVVEEASRSIKESTIPDEEYINEN